MFISQWTISMALLPGLSKPKLSINILNIGKETFKVGGLLTALSFFKLLIIPMKGKELVSVVWVWQGNNPPHQYLVHSVFSDMPCCCCVLLYEVSRNWPVGRFLPGARCRQPWFRMASSSGWSTFWRSPIACPTTRWSTRWPCSWTSASGAQVSQPPGLGPGSRLQCAGGVGSWPSNLMTHEPGMASSSLVENRRQEEGKHFQLVSSYESLKPKYQSGLGKNVL